jgi:transposase-like protein
MVELWINAPVVFVTMPVCPRCGSAEFFRIKTEPPGGDGTKTQRVVCRNSECLKRFKVAYELPESALPNLGNAGGGVA